MKGETRGAIPGFIKLLLLIVYTISVFFIENYFILAFFTFANIFLMIFFRLKITGALRELAGMLPFIFFAAFINLFLGEVREALLVAFRLVLVCNITFIFRRLESSMELARSVELLFIPLKVFKINPEDIGLMVCICIAFIPVLQRELKEIIYGLKAKGMKMSAGNVKYIFKPFFFALFKRTNEIALALKAKGYNG
ncbi:MAG: energy-coupling factor transporter transmembrane protein EcfT [Treponema sp.]|jgi:energy-coupling factor transporter transmembrane protein EcfT|nr:energy-coupling factor transporter transmembrane protein EcfT [Treponema sp.]